MWHTLTGRRDDLIACSHQLYSVGVATLHAPLDAVYCTEMLVLRGISEQMRRIAEHVIGTRGDMHGRLVLTEARRDL